MLPSNTIKRGYKQTEVGVIPEEWALSTVGREFEITLGKMLDAEKNIGVPKPYLGNKAVQWNRIDISELPTVPMSRTDIDKFRLRKGDLLVCEGGEVGRAAIWEAPIEECYYQKALHRLRPLHGFDSRLMVAVLRQWSDRGLLANYVTQTSIAHIPREKLVEVPIPVPTPAEQHAIAGVLSDVDALIDSLDKLIGKKRDIKQAAMHQLLTGKRRLPGFSAEWDAMRLGDNVQRIVGGGTPSRSNPEFWGGNIPWATVKDFATFDPHSTQESITQAGLSKSASHLIPKGTVITSTRMALGKAVIYAVDVSINQDLKAVFPTKDVGSRFLYYWFQQNADYIEELGSGSTVKGILLADLRALQFLRPSPPEQCAISTVLFDMDAEITVLEARRDKTRAIKQGMMQQLLTGNIRLI